MTTLDRADAQSLLADFDAAANRFHAAFEAVPDEALAFRPEGDDYALSGLLIHVAGGLELYSSVLASIVDADFQPVSAGGAAWAEDQALTHDGIQPSARAATVKRVRTAHAELVRQVQRTADVNRKADVRFGDSQEPLATSAADIVGWMREHYNDHVDQIAELLGKWRNAV
jgi:hypothetical protein